MGVENLATAEVGEGGFLYDDLIIASFFLIVTVTTIYLFWDSHNFGHSRERKADEKREIDELLRRRINHDDDGVPFYEYLVRWKPTWQCLDLLEEQEGGQKRFEKIGLVRTCKGKYDECETLIQWSDSWESEDNLGDEALLDGQRKFWGEDSDNLVDGPMDELHESIENEKDDEEDDNSDDDSESDEEELYEFEGQIYHSYQEMVDAKRERNKRVLRRFVYGLLDKSSESHGIGEDEDDDEEEDTDDEGLYEFEGKTYNSYLDMVEAKRERNRRMERRLMMHSLLGESFARNGTNVAVA